MIEQEAYDKGYKQGYADRIEMEKALRVEDCISREAVLNAMYELCDTGESLKENKWRDNPHIDAITDTINDLPSVKPIEPCEDCISIKDAINAIYGLHTGGKEAVEQESVFDHYSEALHDAVYAIEELPSVKPTRTKGEWIPTSERLPKAGEYIGDVDKYYLVQNEYGDMLVARYTHSEYWEQIYQLQPIGDKIVAWMPLPEPYKAESEVTQ